MEFSLNSRKLVGALVAIVAALLVLHVTECALKFIGGHWRLIGFVGTFDMNYENNIPTFFAGFLLVGCAALLAVVAERPDHSPRDRAYWRWLALIFLLLGMDEQASLHELWTEWMHHFFDMDGVLYFAWVIPYGLGVLAVGLLYLRFVLGLPPRMRRLTIAAGLLYVGGALGVEMIGGWYLSAHDEEMDFLYAMIVAVEETLEMLGVVLFIHALLDYLRTGPQGGALSVQIR